jgi:CRISPR type III-B/RAMP module RAMP protein Cmr1
MAKYDFTLELVSPAFIAGTDKARPEMRASSIRGHLRYWGRALLGATITDSKKLYEQESKAFGSTEEGSKFTLLVLPRSFNQEAKPVTVAMLPHKSGRERSETKALRKDPRGEDLVYNLSLIWRPGQPVSGQVLTSLKIWSLLGGLGRRSRRMFGAVRIQPKKDTPAQEEWYELPKSPDELATTIRSLLSQTVKADDKLKDHTPDFPTLHPNHSWIIVGKRAYAKDDYESAVIDLFSELLRKDEFRKKEQTFGYTAGPNKRRASTVHVQLRLINGQLYPVLTALRSKPDRDIDWKHLASFMRAAEDYFESETVWGGW